MINPYTTLISSTEKSNKNSNDEESTKSEAISKVCRGMIICISL